MGPARRAGPARRDPRRRLDRTLACDYGLDIVEIPRYLGSHDRTHNGETIRTFAFTATCADPLQICQHAQVAHYWADFASLPDQTSQDLARLADLALQAAAGWTGDPPRQWQITTALRACSKGMYCEEAATELIINHRSWLLRDDFTKQFILTGAGSAGGITAVIDWEEALTALRAGTLPCSSSEAAILHLGRQPRHCLTRHPAPRHHRTRPDEPPPSHQRGQASRRPELGDGNRNPRGTPEVQRTRCCGRSAAPAARSAPPDPRSSRPCPPAASAAARPTPAAARSPHAAQPRHRAHREHRPHRN